ncbi:Imm49 family immunity protein [Streptomyces sp. NPDC002855]|uniref:Imm49 family immunity protein n=1 Tax=Streptomyces sp. NPDC002855 TaxID=3154437 RepID=UPI0033264F17
MLTRDHDAFAEALAEALAHHGTHWGDSAAPRARVALGPLAMASPAYDYNFPLALPQPHLPTDFPLALPQSHLPTALLDRGRIEEVPGRALAGGLTPRHIEALRGPSGSGALKPS